MLTAKKCDITPDISLMKKMASISGTIPSRIMELVDNSIDAKISGKILEIEVKVVKRGSKHYIEVSDNGSGMTEEEAKNFFRLGDSQKLGKKKIGKFGLGSKVAILGLGDTCKITTSPYGEECSIDIAFDIHKFKEWKIDYRMKSDEKLNHGTKIRIENVSIRIGNVNRFCERLQEQLAKTYKHFIEKGEVVIRVNGQNVETQNIELLPGMYQEFEFEVNGKKVHGWAGAMKKAGVNWKFGFDLISNGRIIKANDFLSRQAHTSLARLTGEIHLDDFPTDIHKTDFIRHDPDFEEMQEKLLSENLNELIAKITKLTNKEVFTKYQEEMISVSKLLNRVVRSFDFLNQIDIDEGIFKKMKKRAEENKNKKEKKKKTTEQTETQMKEYDVFEEIEDLFQSFQAEENEEKQEEKERKPRANNLQMGLIINEPVGISAGEEQPPKRWIVEEKDDGVYIDVEVNLDHPTYQTEEENISVHMKNAVLESVTEFILQEEKKHVGFLEDEIDRYNRIKDILVRYSAQA